MEGPSLVLLKEEARKFIGQKIVSASGSTKALDPEKLVGLNLTSIRTWGKHLLIKFGRELFRVHFLMFGSYRIDEDKVGFKPQLLLDFKNGALRFYSCSIKPVTSPLKESYDWRVDVMSRNWDPGFVLRLLKPKSDVFVCDALLDQTMFSGAGNIIKNEVLFRQRLHPLARVGDLTAAELKRLIAEVRKYSLQFYRWKKAFVLRKHWEIYKKKVCPSCSGPIRLEKTGKLERRTFYCANCQSQ